MAPDSPSASTLLGMGAVIAAALAAGIGLGWLVDTLANTSPLFIIVGLGLGIVGAVSYTVMEFKQYLSITSKKRPQK